MLVHSSGKKRKHVEANVILADPPWRYSFSRSNSRQIENQYATMTVDEIGRLVEGSARTIDSSRVVSCKNGVLYLWATAPKLLEALEVMKIWGFKYKTHMIWDKERVGMGYWFRGRHELLLVGTCGKWSPPIASARVPSVLRYRSRRYKHSAKPPTVHEWIDEWWPDVVKVELFARERRKGWWTHGNEAVNR